MGAIPRIYIRFILLLLLVSSQHLLTSSFEMHVAPMQGYTDMHMRYFFRQILPTATLWSEMLKPKELFQASSHQKSVLLSRGAERDSQQPCVLQFGSDNADDLTNAIKLAGPYGYTRYDLNCGCPSTEVNAHFGANLMRNPTEVAYLLERMADAASYKVPISVKCRIGFHDNYASITEDRYEELFEFCNEVTKSRTVKDITIHARSAVLQGLSPQKNREIPPLRKDLVLKISEEFPHVRIVYNGGLSNFEEVSDLERSSTLAGAMIGRWALQKPFDLLLDERRNLSRRRKTVSDYASYAENLFRTSNRNELVAILFPLVLLAYSLEREAEEAEGDAELDVCYASAWAVMETIVTFTDQLLVDVNNSDLEASFGATAKLRNYAPPFKKFRKFLGDLCGKKLILKMKGNCDEKMKVIH